MQPRPPRRSRGAWYWVVAVLTIGMFVAIPMWHIYGRLKTPRQLKIALAFTFSAITLLILTGAAPTDAQGNTTGFLGTLAGLIGLTNFVCALVAVGLVRGQAYPGGTAELAFGQTPGAPALDEGLAAHEPAVASALEERRRREEARALAQRAPCSPTNCTSDAQIEAVTTTTGVWSTSTAPQQP